MHSDPLSLPAGMTVLERGWLSANNIVFAAAPGAMEGSAVVDTGYVSHSAQTLALIDNALQGQPLARILNTHLHSDHCGGNAALQQTYPQVQTFIAPGEAAQVRNWNESALSYAPTGQECPRFAITGLLQPGSSVRLSGRDWQIHAAPGHDPHSVILFEPVSRLLISADALWERGFGVIFPELEGLDAFDAVADTLDLIEALEPAILIPGHGRVFTDLADSIAFARARLRGFKADPAKHIQHAAKVLLKFKLLETQSQTLESFIDWARGTSYFNLIHQTHFAQTDFSQWADRLILDLVRVGAARREGLMVHNAG